MKTTLLAFLTFYTHIIIAGGPDYYQEKGRIAISSDGNHHDNDDWAATAASLMILAKAKLQDKLVLYTYSDHVWGSLPISEAEMKVSALEGKTKFEFKNSVFIEAVNNITEACNALRNQINLSTENNPLFIIAAGPMHLIGESVKKANPTALKHITIISHSQWNNEHSDKPITNPSKSDVEPSHSGWTWDELKALYSSDINFVKIQDQNNYTSSTIGFATTNAIPDGNRGKKDWEIWSWMKNHSDNRVKWVYNRARLAVKRPDWSDAGMLWYLLKNDEQGGPNKLKDFIGDDFNTSPIINTPEPTNSNPKKGRPNVIGDNFYIWEAENTASDLKDWKLRTPDLPQPTGYIIKPLAPINNTYIEFMGGDLLIPLRPNKGTSLEYKFKCKESGKYGILMRMSKNIPVGESRNDIANDVYIKLSGDFTSATRQYATSTLKKNKKFFGGDKRKWGSGFSLSAHDQNTGKETFKKVFYNLKKDQEYVLTVSGRSFRTCIDYLIVFSDDIKLTNGWGKDLASQNPDIYRPYNDYSLSLNNTLGIKKTYIEYNMMSSILKINTPKENTEVNLTIYNTQGTSVYHKDKLKDSIINIQNLPSGIYLVKVFNQNSNTSKKIIKL